MTKELLFNFFMIYFLNRNDEKWPYTPRQIKIFGRNYILPPLGIENTLIMQSYSIQKHRESYEWLRMFSVQGLIEPCFM